MSKYPYVLCFAADDNEARALRAKLTHEGPTLECTAFVTSDPAQLHGLVTAAYHLVATFSPQARDLVANLVLDPRWHVAVDSLASLNAQVNRAYALSLIPAAILVPEQEQEKEEEKEQKDERKTLVSIFTSAYQSYGKLERAYHSLANQTYVYWEWVIVDDSPDNRPFVWMQQHPLINHDLRVRLFRRGAHGGSIGMVKDEAVALTRGDILVELDHDDILLPDCLADTVDLFAKHLDLGFLYMDFFNLYEPSNKGPKDKDDTNFRYGDVISFGYGSYSLQYIETKSKSEEKGEWRYIYHTPQLNAQTASALIALPNHPRIWARSLLQTIGGFSPRLPVCDDLDVLQRTVHHALLTQTYGPKKTRSRYKLGKLAKPAYGQYMNPPDQGGNFSLLRNAEINRLGPQHLSPAMVNDTLLCDLLLPYPSPLNPSLPLWKQGDVPIHYANLHLSPYDKQIALVGFDALFHWLPWVHIQKEKEEQHKNNKNNKNKTRTKNNSKQTKFVWIDYGPSPHDAKDMCRFLEQQGLQHLVDVVVMAPNMLANEDEVRRFFHGVYASAPCQHLLYTKRPWYATRHELLNALLHRQAQRTLREPRYLEIGVEYGYTLSRIATRPCLKTGVDPEPLFDDLDLLVHRMTSDSFFAQQQEQQEQQQQKRYDVTFVDGLHEAEQVARDIANALRITDGFVVVDDVLPWTEWEQRWPPQQQEEQEAEGNEGNEGKDKVVRYTPGTGPWTGNVWRAIAALLPRLPAGAYSFHPGHLDHRGQLVVDCTRLAGSLDKYERQDGESEGNEGKQEQVPFHEAYPDYVTQVWPDSISIA